MTLNGATIWGMANDLLNTTGDRIQWLRKKKRLTQAALGRAVGVGSVYISQLESNTRSASRALIGMLAAELGTTRAFLELETDDPAVPVPDAPCYFSEEADAAARLIDAMRSATQYCYPYHAGGSIGTARVLAALAVAVDVLAGADLSAVPDDDADRAAELDRRLAEHAAAIQRHQGALRRADTAFVSGVMDEDRYREQVTRLRAATEAEQSAQVQLQAAALADQQRGSRANRLREIAASGRAMLTTPDTAAANTWLRRYVRVFVRGNQVVEVRWL